MTNFAMSFVKNIQNQINRFIVIIFFTISVLMLQNVTQNHRNDYIR